MRLLDVNLLVYATFASMPRHAGWTATRPFPGQSREKWMAREGAGV